MLTHSELRMRTYDRHVRALLPLESLRVRQEPEDIGGLPEVQRGQGHCLRIARAVFIAGKSKLTVKIATE